MPEFVEGLRPDERIPLSVTLSLASPPELPQPGQRSTFRIAVRNGGPTAQSDVIVILLVNARPVHTAKLQLPPDATTEVDLDWTVPASGRYSITAVVDPTHLVPLESRDDAAATITIAVGEPVGAPGSVTAPADDERADADVRVVDVSLATVSVPADAPRRLTASFRVVNAGRRPLARGCAVTIGIETADQGDPQRHSLTLESLEPDAEIGVSHSFDLPAGAHAAMVRVAVDPDDRIAPASAAKRADLEFRNPAANVDRWVSIGPTLLTEGLGAVGRLHHIVIDPTRPNTMYVASGGGSGSGIWKTTDEGATWDPVTDGFGTPNVKALAMDPSDPSRLFAATTRGLIRTTDGGTTWATVADNDVLGGGSADESLHVDPGDPSTLYATSGAGVLVSTDGGARWSVTLAAGRATDLILDRTHPARLVAAIRNDNDPVVTGVHESVDAGASWRQLTGCPGGRLPTARRGTTVRLAISRGTLFASYQTTSDWTLYRTTDVGCSIGGRSETVWARGWRPTGAVGSDPIFKRLWKFIYADPSDPKFVYAGGTDLWMSGDSGDTFTRTTEPHVDHQAFAVRPTNHRTIYTLSDGGIYRSTARGSAGSWSFIGRGIRNVEFYDLASAPTNPDVVIGGTQDNGTVRYDAPSTTWAWKRGGDGATVAIDPFDEDIMYSMGQHADSISRSGNGGDDWTSISGALPAGQCYNLHYQVHPTNPKIVLASCMSLWRLRQPGSTWQAILTLSGGTGVVRSAVDPAADVYYAGTSNGALHAGIGGTGFSLILQNSTGREVTDIEVDPDDPTTVFVTFRGDRGRVMRVRRAGRAPFTYTAEDITVDLPVDLRAQSVAVDRMHPRTIYLGTQRGVYRGRLATATGPWAWTRYGNGIPDPDVRAVHVHPATGVLRAASLGRGVYEVNTGPPLGSVLVATGRITFLRAHERGSGFGDGSEFLDVEAVVKLAGAPGQSFGLRLRQGPDEHAAVAMFDHLRDAFRRDVPVRIEYTRTGLRSGLILRVSRP